MIVGNNWSCCTKCRNRLLQHGVWMREAPFSLLNVSIKSPQTICSFFVWLQFSFDKQCLVWLQRGAKVKGANRDQIICCSYAVGSWQFDPASLDSAAPSAALQRDPKTVINHSGVAAVTLYPCTPALFVRLLYVLICVFVSARLMSQSGDAEKRFCHTQFGH